MAEKETKEMKITPTACVDSGRSTKGGSKIYNIKFRPEGSEFEMAGATFSSTIAEEVEKNIDKLVTVKMVIGEYNGNPSYSISEINGVKGSGFKKGAGFAKDIVSIERRTAAEVAAQILGYKDLTGKKSVERQWQELADKVYVWISTRPSEPEASGGKTEQAVDDSPAISDDDIPPEFKG